MKKVLVAAAAVVALASVSVFLATASASSGGVSIVIDSGSAVCDPVFSGSPCFGPPNTGLHSGDATTLLVTVEQTTPEANATTAITWPAGALTFVTNGDLSAGCVATTSSVTCTYTDFAHGDKSDHFDFTVGPNAPGSDVTASITTTTSDGSDSANASFQMAPATGSFTPAIFLPANNSTVTVSNMVKVDWTDSTGGAPPVQYQYEAYSDAGYTSLIYQSGWLAASEIPTPGTPPGVYYLRVRALDANNLESDWSNGPGTPYMVTVVADPVLSPVHAWVGLKNSDDQGTQFDLRAQLKDGDTVLATATQTCVKGITRNPSLATEAILNWDHSATINPGDKIVLSARIGTGPNCSGHSNATGLRLYYDSTSRKSGFDLNGVDQYLHSSTFFNTTAPLGSVAATLDSPAVKLAGANAYQTIGTWTGP